MVIFLFLFYFVTTVDCFYFQKDGVDIKYKVTSLKTCVDIPEMSKLSITSVPLNDCVFNCAVTWNCQGLVFKRQFPLCELYKGAVNKFERTGNCVHIKREDIHDLDDNGQTCAKNDSACSTIAGCQYPKIPNGTPEGNMFSIGSTQTINCDTGYVIHGNDTIKCMENGNWTSLPECREGCQYPEIPNGKPEGKMFSIGSTQTINCDTGYVIHGNDTIKCMENGTWTLLPECLKECTELMIPFANVIWNTTHADMTCYTDFVSNKTKDYSKIITTETFTCDKQGNWSPNVECTHYNNIKNVALYKNVGSENVCGDDEKATDGKWDCNMIDPCSDGLSSGDTDIIAWWEVDLHDFYPVKRVLIRGNKSGVQYRVFVGNRTTTMKPCDKPGTVHGDTVKFTCNDIGRYVKIRSREHFVLCEVGVYED